jgi:hypothetical protein
MIETHFQRGADFHIHDTDGRLNIRFRVPLLDGFELAYLKTLATGTAATTRARTAASAHWRLPFETTSS